MVQVRVLGVALDATGQHVVLLKPVLEEPGGGRVLPIWIGAQEATSILIALEGDHAPRPLSHDLIVLLLDALGSRLERVEITRIEDGTFYAELTLVASSGVTVLVDARPSDAIGIALRADVPIQVAEAVLDDAGMPAELAEWREADEARVDEFKKFLDDAEPEDFNG